ncbi:Permease of the drug/metabolite transporter (DMT) superfamily [Agreia sp. COWG]|nr:EamA family transporter [Agreia sp. COWG]CAD6001717.1 Permease of the drug/metabolite transporter (DMT) superfamily [Agreia sp. COWG]
MLSKLLTLRTALAPAIWGTTYLVTTTMLPENTPLLAGAARALPAGVLLLLLTRKLPQGSWWWKSLILGALNIGVFFPLLFIAAYRLPGGVAATLGAIQPLIVATLAVRLVGERVRPSSLLAGVVGVGGVALLVLQAGARLDTIGVAAAFGGSASMALGIVLGKRWASTVGPLSLTAWQLIWGGLLILPVMAVVEGVPTRLTGQNLAAFAYLSIIGGAVAYTVWFAGSRRLPAVTTSFLGLLSPLVAALLGWVLLGQDFTLGQIVGAILVLAALVTVVLLGAPSGSVGANAPAVRASGGGTPVTPTRGVEKHPPTVRLSALLQEQSIWPAQRHKGLHGDEPESELHSDPRSRAVELPRDVG